MDGWMDGWIMQALKQKQTEDMESDLLAYLGSSPPQVSSVGTPSAAAAGGASHDLAVTVTHELIEVRT